MSLALNLHSNSDGNGHTLTLNHILKPVIVNKDHHIPLGIDQHLSFQSSQRLNGGPERSDTYAFVGSLQINHEETPYSDVVCKLVFGDTAVRRIKHEAKIYTTNLKTLQGTRIPRFYGLFKVHQDYWSTEDSTTSILPLACLLLEYCGNQHPTPLRQLDDAVRMDVINAFVEIHDKGVKHADINEGHVLFSTETRDGDSGIRIIDFDRAEQHVCLCDIDFELDTWQPLQDDVDCAELYTVATMLEIWVPWRIFFKYGVISVFITPDTKSMLDKIGHMLPSDSEGRKDVIEEAEKTFEAYYKRYQDRFGPIGDPRNKRDEKEGDKGLESPPIEITE